MTTRLERLQAQTARTKEKIAQEQQKLAALEIRKKHEADESWKKRAFRLGMRLMETPLARLKDEELRDLFAVVAPLTETPAFLTALSRVLTEGGGTLPEAGGVENTTPPEAYAPLTGTVYILQMEGHAGLKIGYTMGDVATRIAALQIGCPAPLHVLKAYVCRSPQYMEYLLHARLASSRVSGEWFDTTVADVDTAWTVLSQNLWLRAPMDVEPLFPDHFTPSADRVVSVRQPHPGTNFSTGDWHHGPSALSQDGVS